MILKRGDYMYFVGIGHKSIFPLMHYLQCIIACRDLNEVEKK